MMIIFCEFYYGLSFPSEENKSYKSEVPALASRIPGVIVAVIKDHCLTGVWLYYTVRQSGAWMTLQMVVDGHKNAVIFSTTGSTVHQKRSSVRRLNSLKYKKIKHPGDL